jgi:predicted ferric reductase
LRRSLGASRTGLAAAGLVASGAAAGYLLGRGVAPATANRMFPWIVARATGIGAYLALATMAVAGLLFRRPVRPDAAIRPETYLRYHIYLGPALLALMTAHVWALLADRYAGIPLRSLVVPDGATYRPGAVTFGVIAAYLLFVVIVTAALAGRRPVGRRWAPAHRLAYPAFVLAWVHGVLAGSDTPALRWLYVVSGIAVVAAAARAALRRPLAGPAEVSR